MNLDDLGRDFAPPGLLGSELVAQRATSFWDPSPMRAAAMIRPASTIEVAEVLKWCNSRREPIITQGGLTGCVAGTHSGPEDLVMSLERMNTIEEIDTVDGIAIVRAGAVLEQVQTAVSEAGWYFPLDLGARGSCTIGGNIATNAGGINVLRYGMTRHLVLGLEAVLADGTIISSMNKMLKSNAGYDVKQLFIGSEGTLGVVTRAVLKLHPPNTSCETALLALDDFANVSPLLAFLQQELAGTLSAFELMWGDYFYAVTEAGGHTAPLARDYPLYLIVQAEGADPDSDSKRFEIVLEKALDSSLIVDAVIPKSEGQRRAIWDIRENFESVLMPRPVYLYDVSMPIRDMASYVDSVRKGVEAQWPAGACFVIGHVADGNLHLFIRPNEQGDWREQSDQLVYEPLRGLNGSVSAEHGIGLEKVAWLPVSRAISEIELMRTLKRTLDPYCLLNPGRVIAS